MARMVRKQVYIEPRQEELLKRRAKELGVSEAELIRRGIEAVAEAVSPNAPAQAWADARAFIVKRMQLKVPQTGRQWTRDELYEDRIGRLSR